MKKKIYLASPYWHENSLMRVLRYNNVTEAAGELLKRNFVVFSPITHSHLIAINWSGHTPNGDYGHKFWLEQDSYFLEWADEVFVFTQNGWDHSVGVEWEIAWAEDHDMPVRYLTPGTFEICEEAPDA